MEAQEQGIAYLPSTQEGLPAYLPSTQEEDPAYLPSAQAGPSTHLSSAHEYGPAHLASAQAADSRQQAGSEVTLLDLCLGQPREAYQTSLNVWTQADYGTNARMSVWVANAHASTVRKLGTMAGGGRTGRRGGRTGRVGRPPLNRRSEEEESVHAEHTESVHETNVTPTGDGNQGPIQLEPEVRDAIAREVVLTLKNILPDLLSEALKRSKEEDEGNNEEKIYDSDGDEVKVASRNRGCTYKGFKDGDPPNSVATFEWIERMNAVINISECRPDQAVIYVAHSFTNEALGWWRNIQRTKSPNAIARMTWEDLKKLIIQKFCPQNEIDRVENEFLNFKAGNKTHRQYTSRFNELA
ncbi:hypothetical protein L1987_74341 [Smallanthus sonchifolius]|uniref:Uncharacterized protein n=1 Tax=Smallanthus sonchifolius TaxID=185202 RepID=A0ACB9A2R6_9ASTR|nr:hypothetical protein L1987_74341 [Smallanthus sonchifolius]